MNARFVLVPHSCLSIIENAALRTNGRSGEAAPQHQIDRRKAAMGRLRQS
jgi:hypothetical protein